MTDPRIVTRPRWCSTCSRAIEVTVRMLLPRPVDPYARSRWDDACRREVDVAYYNGHAATCGKRVTTSTR